MRPGAPDTQVSKHRVPSRIGNGSSRTFECAAAGSGGHRHCHAGSWTAVVVPHLDHRLDYGIEDLATEGGNRRVGGDDDVALTRRRGGGKRHRRALESVGPSGGRLLPKGRTQNPLYRGAPVRSGRGYPSGDAPASLSSPLHLDTRDWIVGVIGDPHNQRFGQRLAGCPVLVITVSHLDVGGGFRLRLRTVE